MASDSTGMELVMFMGDNKMSVIVMVEEIKLKLEDVYVGLILF